MKLVRKGMSANSRHDRWLHPAEDRIECIDCYGEDEDCRKCAGTGFVPASDDDEVEAEGKGELVLRKNPRALGISDRLHKTLTPIIGASLALEVARNVAMAYALDDDDIYEPEESLDEMVRRALAQRLAHPKTYRAGHLTEEMIDEAVAAVTEMDSAGNLKEALTSFFETSINEHGTPYVSHPEDFTRSEQGEFIDFIRQPRLVSRDEQLAKLREIIAARGSLKPNRASTLNGRASMDTKHVGREVDPDRYTGARGKDLDAAMSRYETFHAKRPLRIVELSHDLPKLVVPVGQVISTMYRTDKWHDDGDDEDYKHVHDNSRGGKEREYEIGKGVIAYEPAHMLKRSRVEGRTKKNFAGSTHSMRLPVSAPQALPLLGYCLGVFVQRFDDGEIYEVNPRGCYLLASPKGDMLAVYSPDKQPDGTIGFMMIMAGGGLRVLEGGIDG